MSKFVAVDWGTTNRRIYLIDGGATRHTECDDTGILSVPPGGFAAEVARLRERFDSAPMLLAGMVGSNRGWIDVGYVPCPATLPVLAAALVEAEPGIAIVPGVSAVTGTGGDVMRGEEVQLLGAVAAGLAPADARLCQPGTHCKWANMAHGTLAGFATAMTGEMFALLRDHALIGAAMTGTAAPDAAFREGVARAAENDLLAALFGTRPATLLGLRDMGSITSYVSGLLIGSDVRGQVRAGDTIHLLADGMLESLYACAIEEVGADAVMIDSQAAFVAGMSELWELSGQ